MNIDWQHELTLVGRLAVAFVLAMPIAWNREKANRIMGLRTFPLVAVASCAFTLIGLGFIAPDADDALARILQGIITGVGFIGGGAIIRMEDHVTGTATAASIWLTGGLGIAVAFDDYLIAVTLSVANYGILRYLSRLKQQVDEA